MAATVDFQPRRANTARAAARLRRQADHLDRLAAGLAAEAWLPGDALDQARQAAAALEDTAVLLRRAAAAAELG